MTISELKKEIFDHYLDRDLQVTILRDPGKWSTGNGLIHLGIFYTLLGINKAIDRNDIEMFTNAITMCWVEDSKGPVHGLLNRNKDRRDKEGQDDYIGVCSGSYFTNQRISSYIVSYGEANHFCFDNDRPFEFHFSSWFGRFPGLIGFMRMSNGREPGWVQELLLKDSLWFGPSKDCSETIKQWLQIQVAKRNTKKFDSVISKWEKLFVKRYGSIGAMFAPYFGSDHPFARLTGLTGFDS